MTKCLMRISFILVAILVLNISPISALGGATHKEREVHAASVTLLDQRVLLQPLPKDEAEEGYTLTLDNVRKLMTVDFLQNCTGKGIRVAVIELSDDPTTPASDDNGFYTGNDAPYYNSIELVKDYSDNTPNDVSCSNAPQAHGSKMATVVNAIAPDGKIILIRVGTQDQLMQALDDCSDRD